MTINGKTTALILAPDAIVDAKFNVNGQIIANNIKINEEFHRDSFTFKSSITVRGGLKARKTLDGSNKLGNINTIFQFELSAVSAKNMSNEAITDIPMPDYASDSERSAKKMTCDSDLNGVINFGFIEFKEEGDYTYKIVEKRPDNSIAYEDGYYADGYLYDGNEYTVTVHARRTQTGGIGIYGYDIKKNDEDLGFMDYETGKQNGVVTFANSTLSPDKACVKIQKEFDGEWPEEGFKFELKGISKEENGQIEQWKNYFALPTYKDYEAGMSKTVKVTEDSPYADFGIIKYDPNGSQKYTFELKEIVEGATPTEDPNKVLKDGIIYDITPYTVVIEPIVVGNNRFIKTTFSGEGVRGEAKIEFLFSKTNGLILTIYGCNYTNYVDCVIKVKLGENVDQLIPTDVDGTSILFQDMGQIRKIIELLECGEEFKLSILMKTGYTDMNSSFLFSIYGNTDVKKALASIGIELGYDGNYDYHGEAPDEDDYSDPTTLDEQTLMNRVIDEE